jgi:hypothetical protein
LDNNSDTYSDLFNDTDSESNYPTDFQTTSSRTMVESSINGSTVVDPELELEPDSDSEFVNELESIFESFIIRHNFIRDNFGDVLGSLSQVGNVVRVNREFALLDLIGDAPINSNINSLFLGIFISTFKIKNI